MALIYKSAINKSWKKHPIIKQTRLLNRVECLIPNLKVVAHITGSQ